MTQKRVVSMTARPFRITPSSCPPSPQAPIAKPLRRLQQARALDSIRPLAMITIRAIFGNGNSDELGRLLGQQPDDPGMLLRLLPGVSNKRSPCWRCRRAAPCPRRVLPRHKSDPCRKVSIGFEAARVCDSRSDGRGPDHAYPGHGLEAAAHIIGTMMGVNDAIQSSDLQF